MPAPKHRAKVDENQKQIVRDLKKLGVSVQDLSAVGGGCPDLAASHNGRTVFIEIKNPERTGKKRELHASQVRWHNNWQGEAIVVENVDQALDAFGIKLRGVIG